MLMGCRDKDLHARIMDKYRIAQKVRNIMLKQLEEEQDTFWMGDLKKKYSALLKLYAVKRVPKDQRHDTKKIFKQIESIMENDRTQLYQ